MLPPTTVLGRVAGRTTCRSAANHDDARAARLPFDAPLFFANAAVLREEVIKLVDASDPPTREVVIDAEGMVDMDVTGAEALDELMDQLEGRGVRLVLARARSTLRATLSRMGSRSRSAPTASRCASATPSRITCAARRTSTRLRPRAPTPHPRPAGPPAMGDAQALRDRDDPGMPVSDDVRESGPRESPTRGATACCGATSRGGDGVVAREGRSPLATASSAPVPPLPVLPGGAFRMGSTEQRYPADGEGPPRIVHVAAFRIAVHAVRNDDFAAFVSATGYLTTAEREGWSFVFGGLLPADFPPTRAVAGAPWWRQVPGACWHSMMPDLGAVLRNAALPVATLLTRLY